MLNPVSARTAATTFIGRRSELASLTRVLRSAPLVTITGAGGSGKTRLAAALLPRLGQAVWVDLADLRDGTSVTAAIERALGIPGDGTLSVELLARSPAGTPRLVVLDNCEHLLTECRVAVVRLMDSPLRCRVLATSRSPLGIGGEVIWRLPPLSLPDPGNVDGIGQGTRADAVRLFVERARAVRSDLRLDAPAYRLIADICRRVDGLPLAIELVASRLRTMPLEELVERLDTLPNSAALGGVEDRHQTMSAALDWSYSLLDPDARVLLRSLAVFAGSFTVASAQAMVDFDPKLTQGAIDALVDQSLLELSSETDRYRLLEPVRQYAEALLVEAREDRDAIARAAGYVVKLVTQTLGLESGVPGADLLIRSEFPNAAAFMPHLLTEDPGAALRLITRFAVRYRSSVPVHLSVVASWLERGLANYRARNSTRAWALYAFAFMRWTLDGIDTTGELPRRASSEALDIAMECGDAKVAAQARLNLALLAATYGPTDEALAQYDDVIPTLTDPRMMAMAHSRRAVLRDRNADHTGAEADLRSAFLAWDRYNDPLLSGRALTMLCSAEVLYAAGRIDEAVVEARRAVAAHRSSGEPPESAAFVALAHLAAAGGNDERALRLAGVADRLRQIVGSWLEPRFMLTDGSWLPRLEARLGRRAARLRAQGRAFGLGDAVAYALGEITSTQLTTREHEVARLVAEGLSNKEIGIRLRISERTAENHIQRVRDKLGLRSRTQVARWIADESAGPGRKSPTSDTRISA